MEKHDSPSFRTPPLAPALVFAGVAVAVFAWLLPVSLKSVSRGLLRSAGEGTPSVSAFGRDLVDSEKIGPALLMLNAARAVGDPGAPGLEQALGGLSSRQPSLVAWGGWDPSLDPLLSLRQATVRRESTPLMTFLIPEGARDAVRAYLAKSESLGVQAVLRTREVPATGRFVPASRPGGQPLDALILATGLLYQSEHMSPTLHARGACPRRDAAAQKGELGDLEGFYLDLLSLGRRLDWTQLGELLRRTESVETVAEYAHLSRVAPDQLPFIYSAALLSDSADRVASYLIRFGKAGSEDLRLALADGQGAVNLLLRREVPVNRAPGPAMGAASALVLEHPRLMLAAKYAGYILGLFLLLRGLDLWIVSPAGGPSAGPQQHVRAGMLAVVLSALLVVATEPFLLKAAPASEYRLRLELPMLATTATQTPPAQSQLRSLWKHQRSSQSACSPPSRSACTWPACARSARSRARTPPPRSSCA